MEKMGKENNISNIEYVFTDIKSEFVRFINEININKND